MPPNNPKPAQNEQLFTIASNEFTKSPFEGHGVRGKIPLLPEERDDPKSKATRLKGAPQESIASAILYEGYPVDILYPVISSFTPGITKAEKSKNNQLVQKAASQLFRAFKNDSSAIENAYRYLEIAKLDAPNHFDAIEDVKGFLTANFCEMASKSSFELNDVQLSYLFEQSAIGVFKEDFEFILANFLSREKDTKKIVETYYKMASFAVSSEDEDQISYILRVLLYETELLDEKSLQAIAIATGLFSEDDDTLLLANELDSFVYILGPILEPELFNKYVKDGDVNIYGKTLSTPKAHETLFNLSGIGLDNLDPRVGILIASGEGDIAEIADSLSLVGEKRKKFVRYMKLARFYNDASSRWVEVPQDKKNVFPYNLFLSTSGVVRRATQRLAAEHQRDDENFDLDNISLPGGYDQMYNFSETEDKFSFVRDLVKQALHLEPSEGFENLDTAQIKTVLSYLRPDINSEQITILSSLNRQLKHDLTVGREDKMLRGVSMRGNLVEVTDNKLLDLGFKSMHFEKGVKAGLTNVIINVGNYSVHLSIDLKQRLVNAGGNEITKPPLSIPWLSAKWFETVVLAHLHEVSFVEPKTKGGIETTSDEVLQNETVVARDGHLRRLAPGWVYGSEQVTLATEEKGWDLVAINKAREETNMRPVTYVKEVRRDDLIVGDLPPIVTKSVSAMDWGF